MARVECSWKRHNPLRTPFVTFNS